MPLSDESSNEQMRHPKQRVVDQRQQQIDPAGKFRRDDNARPKSNTKQPSDLDDTPEE